MPPREIPSLKQLFEKPVSSLAMDDEDIDYMPESGNGEGPLRGVGASAAAQASFVAGKARDLATSAFAGAAQQGAKLKSMIPIGAGGSANRRDSEESLKDLRASEDAEARGRRNELLGTPPVLRSGTPPNQPDYRTAGASSYNTQRASTPHSGGGKSNKARMHRRTASEVRRVYGHTRAQDARAVMERNKELLAERGQKLKNLDERSAAMQSDAEDFAGLAQELEAAFANRKWWHF